MDMVVIVDGDIADGSVVFVAMFAVISEMAGMNDDGRKNAPLWMNVVWEDSTG